MKDFNDKIDEINIKEFKDGVLPLFKQKTTRIVEEVVYPPLELGKDQKQALYD